MLWYIRVKSVVLHYHVCVYCRYVDWWVVEHSERNILDNLIILDE